MMIDTTNWKEFRVEDYFDIRAGKYHYPAEYQNGKTPYISATAENNGIGEYIDLKPEFTGNVITTEKVKCSAFYQSDDFCATSDVNILTPKGFQLNKYIGMFLSTVINFNENFRWNYGKQCRIQNMKKMSVKLPADKNGNPDWNFMENYIKSLQISLPQTKNTSKNETVNTTNWKEFRIGDILNCKTTKPLIETNPGTIPYVTRSAINNGVNDFIEQQDYKLNNGNCITIGAEGTIAFYQPDDFISGVKIYSLTHKNINQYNAIFLCTILNKSAYKYSYGRARILDKIKEEIIKLPATTDMDGNIVPDWNFMENYIKSLPYADLI